MNAATMFSFKGRARRLEYWIVNVGWGLVSGLVSAIIGDEPELTGGVILAIVTIAFLWAAIAVGVRRLHDRDKAGWWVLVWLIPIVGWIWGLIEGGFLKGTVGANRFGADPVPAS